MHTFLDIYLACASSRLWSVMVMICCNMSSNVLFSSLAVRSSRAILHMLRQAGVSGHAHPVRGVHQPGLIIHPRRCSLDSGDFFNSRLGEGKFLQELSLHSPFSFWMSGARLQHGERGEKAKLLLTAGLGEI